MAAPRWLATSPTPASSTDTTCWCSRSCSAPEIGMFSDTDRDKQMLILVESESHHNGIHKLVYDVVR
jgi:hypothetical protein